MAQKAATVSTVAGSGGVGFFEGGFADGAATRDARFNRPLDVAVAADGVVYVADTHNHRVRVVERGAVRTLAGDGRCARRDGRGAGASFAKPSALCLDEPRRTLYVAEAAAVRAVRVLSSEDRRRRRAAAEAEEIGSPPGDARELQ